MSFNFLALKRGSPSHYVIGRSDNFRPRSGREEVEGPEGTGERKWREKMEVEGERKKKKDERGPGEVGEEEISRGGMEEKIRKMKTRERRERRVGRGEEEREG